MRCLPDTVEAVPPPPENQGAERLKKRGERKNRPDMVGATTASEQKPTSRAQIERGFHQSVSDATSRRQSQSRRLLRHVQAKYFFIIVILVLAFGCLYGLYSTQPGQRLIDK